MEPELNNGTEIYLQFSALMQLAGLPAAPQSPAKPHLNLALIIGISVGCVILLFAVLVGVVMCKRQLPEEYGAVHD